MIQESINLLGKHGVDKITGYKGVISSVCFDLYGCVQLALTPPATAEGKIESGTWFDVHRVQVQEDAPRVMGVPDFRAMARQPEDFSHGPAEKPAPRN